MSDGVVNTTISAKVIQVLAGGEISVSAIFHTLQHFTTKDGTIQTIQWKDLPYTTAKPSEIILVDMNGTSRTFSYLKTVKHGPHSFTHTYQNRENVQDLLRLVHIS